MITIMLVIWIMTIMGWVTMEILHSRERKDLYDRLMAANYTDYVQSQSPPPKPKENPLKATIKGAYRNQRNFEDSE